MMFFILANLSVKLTQDFQVEELPGGLRPKSFCHFVAKIPFYSDRPRRPLGDKKEGCASFWPEVSIRGQRVGEGEGQW